MWRHFQTLRFKLAVLYLVVFGTILTALGVIVLTVCEKDLRREFDAGLMDRAQAMAERIVIAADDRSTRQLPQPATAPATAPATGPAPSSATGPLNPYRFPGYYLQLRLVDETVAERSTNLGRQTLPFSPLARTSRSSHEPVLEILRDDPARALIGTETGELRLLTLYHERQGTHPFYLQVAVNLNRVNQAVAGLRRLFWMAIPAGLAVAAIASWLLAKRPLAPIRKIAEIADRLGAHNLSQRFDQPPTKDEVSTMVATINDMLDRLAEAFEAQERFLTDVSHELKTPLSVLLGEAQVLLQRQRSAEEYERFVVSVQDEVRSLAQTVDSVLTLAHAEAGVPTSRSAEVSLNEIVMDAVERCQGLARQRDVRLVPTLAPPQGDRPEPVVLGDDELLCIMFVNLLRNAVRYSPPGQAADIRVELRDHQAVVSVRDRGPGIPPQYIDRVFERFFRVPQSDGGFKGAGLGLTIVRGVARVHGGSVTVANHPNGGCEFLVRLPLARAR